VLLIAAGLLIKSFDQLSQVAPGFDSSQVISMRIELPQPRYADPARTRSFYQELVGRVAALPGVTAVGLINHVPLQDFSMLGFFKIEGTPVLNPKDESPIPIGVVNVDYFRALRISVRSGETFSGRETPESRKVALVNQSFTRRFFPKGDALGKRISQGCPNDELCRTIIGVGDIRQEALINAPTPEVFVPLAQMPVGGMTLLARAKSDPLALVQPIRQQVLAIDPDQPISRIQTLSDRLQQATAQQRALMLLLVRLAGLALILAVIGIYGVISYSVSQRTREFGIRLALGATRRDIIRLVVGNGMLLAICGIAVGVAAAWAVTRLMQSLLFGVAPTDLPTFSAVALLLGGFTILAAYFPAQRATRVNPVVALRHD
jgi:putative ABC transport system permease protein